MINMIIVLLTGILITILGRQLYSKQQITLLHSYHYKNVGEKDKEVYTKKMGTGLLICGLSLTLTGMVEFITKSEFSWLIFGFCFSIAMVIMIKTQYKYNGSIF